MLVIVSYLSVRLCIKRCHIDDDDDGDGDDDNGVLYDVRVLCLCVCLPIDGALCMMVYINTYKHQTNSVQHSDDERAFLSTRVCMYVCLALYTTTTMMHYHKIYIVCVCVCVCVLEENKNKFDYHSVTYNKVN